MSDTPVHALHWSHVLRVNCFSVLRHRDKIVESLASLTIRKSIQVICKIGKVGIMSNWWGSYVSTIYIIKGRKGLAEFERTWNPWHWSRKLYTFAFPLYSILQRYFIHPILFYCKYYYLIYQIKAAALKSRGIEKMLAQRAPHCMTQCNYAASHGP